MDKETVQRIKNSPKYKELVQTRSKFAWKLAAFIFVMYYGFILLLAYKPEVLGASLTGGVTTVGIPVGLAIIIISFITTGIYTKKANRDFDKLTREIKSELKEAENA
ncbi:MAG: DUF485 domain-containing protein [Campylobacterota bacterium]